MVCTAPRSARSGVPLVGDTIVSALPVPANPGVRCARTGSPEDEGFEGDEGPAAIHVVERCVDDLQQIEESLDRLEMRL